MDSLDGFALLLVDDHPLFRDGLATALQHRVPRMRVRAVGTLTQALDALAIEADGFDLVLLDYQLPGMNGLRCAQLLMQRHPDVGVGLISGAEDPTLPQRACGAGLVAYLPKTLEIQVFTAHLRNLASGQAVFETAGDPTAAERDSANPYRLTARQLEVLRVLATGASNKEIAQMVGISPATVKNHLEAIYLKTGAANRLQAVTLARDLLRHRAG